MANMRNLRRALGAMLVAIGALFFQPMDARASDPIRIALGDVPGADWLIMLVAIEHAKAQGLDIEVLWLNQEDTANQAVLNGQAELGSGTPYTIIQNVPDQMRFVFQNYKVQFYPVANKAMFPDWASTNGQPIVLHSQAGATTVMAHLIEQEYGIEFSDEIFLPGSEVRANAMLEGTANLTYVDATNKDRILAERPGEFHVLPSGDLAASDEAMFARIDWIESHPSELETLIESFLHVYRRVAVDPFYAIEERARLGLLPELPAEMDGAVAKYMIDGAADSIFPPNLGGRGAAELDIRFFAAGGQIEGDPASLKVEDFWDLGPLERVLARVGTASASFTAP